MMILAHSITDFENGKKEHAISFDFESKNFEAVVIEEDNQTYISEIYLMFGRGSVEIDIPDFFGKGFSNEVFSLIYNKVDSSYKEEEEENFN